MKKIIKTPSGTVLDLNEIAAAKLYYKRNYKRYEVIVWFKGNNWTIIATYEDEAAAQKYFDELIELWTKDD